MDRPRKRIVPQTSVGAFLHFFKVKLRFAFSAVSSKTRSVRRTFFVGIAAFAASSLSAARSERSMYFPSMGSARSSSVNCRREDGRCLAAEPSRTAWCQPFPPFVRFSSHGVPPHAGKVSRSASGFSEEADSSVSGSRLLICFTSPVARFSDTAPSRVIFCVILSVVFSSLIGSHLPFHRGRSRRRCHSRSWRYSENGIGLGRADRISHVFSRSARSSMRSVMRGIPSGSAVQRIRPSILLGSP